MVVGWYRWPNLLGFHFPFVRLFFLFKSCPRFDTFVRIDVKEADEDSTLVIELYDKNKSGDDTHVARCVGRSNPPSQALYSKL